MSFTAPTRDPVAAAMWNESHKGPRLPAAPKRRYVEADASPQASPASLPSSDGSEVSHVRCRSVSSTYAESLTYSASTLSSRPSTPSVCGFPCSPRGASFEPWISSQSPRFPGEDHLIGHIFSPSHSRTPSLDSQVHVMMGYTHRPKSPRRPPSRLERSASIDLPLRIRPFEPRDKDPLPEDEEEDDEGTNMAPSSDSAAKHHTETRPSTADSRSYEPLHTKGRRRCTSFLMTPPPRKAKRGNGRGQSLASAQGTASAPDDVDNAGSVSLDATDPVIRQICCNILMELHGIDAVEATIPLKVWDAVVRCLDDVSVAVDRNTAGRSHSGSGPYRCATVGGNSAASTPGQGFGPGDSTSRKRNSQQAGYNDGDASGDGAADEQQGGDDATREDSQRKKPKVDSEQSAFSCPFRKRNPLRFNIRDHEHCCRKPIIGVPELKRHIRTYHRREAPSLYQCRRCKKGFSSEEALDEHSILPLDLMCKPSSRAQSDDPEDGITDEMDKVLAGRKSTSKVQCWDQIWRLIFPDMHIISPAFEPVIEHFEVKRELNVSMVSLRSQLQDALKQYLPDLDDFLLFSVQRSLETVVEIYTATAIRNCRNRVGQQSTTSTSSERRQTRQLGNGGKRATGRGSANTPQDNGEAATVTATFRSIAPKPGTSESLASPPAKMVDQAENQSPTPATSEGPFPVANGLSLRQFATTFVNSKTDDPKQRDSGIVMECPVCLDERGDCSCSYDELPIIDVSMFAHPEEQGSCDAGAPFHATYGRMVASPAAVSHGDQLPIREAGDVTHAFQQASTMPFEFMAAYNSYYNDYAS